MIPKMYESEFAKYDNATTGVKGNVHVGDVAKIETEFVPDVSTKYPESKGLRGKILLHGDGGLKLDLRINGSTYRLISSVFGVDTADWVGKSIQYKGLIPCGKGAPGHVWHAVTE